MSDWPLWGTPTEADISRAISRATMELEAVRQHDEDDGNSERDDGIRVAHGPASTRSAAPRTTRQRLLTPAGRSRRNVRQATSTLGKRVLPVAVLGASGSGAGRPMR